MSFDKVISYDTSSLVEGIGEKENRSKNKQANMAGVPHLKQRPVTSKVVSPVAQSLNDQFNQKLIQYGTNNGVPLSELPDPSSVFSMQQREAAVRKSGDGQATLVSSANYASSYQLKQKQGMRPPSGLPPRHRQLAQSISFATAKNANMKIESDQLVTRDTSAGSHLQT